MKLLPLLFLATCFSVANAQSDVKPTALVSFDDYEKLVQKVKQHRQARLVDMNAFLKMSREPGTLILDTRSDARYAACHLKGAVHLNFADFTQDNLAAIIPSTTTRILIYCNNNIADEPINFASKVMRMQPPAKSVTLALNIPTYINLYGYGYQNVFELSELVSIHDKRLEFEGSEALRRIK